MNHLSQALWRCHGATILCGPGNQQVLRTNDPLGEALQGMSEVTAARRP